MIEIRVRHENEAVGQRLMDWDPTRLDEVIPLLNGWSVYRGGDVEYATVGGGQFVVNETGAYFEVLLSDDE